MRGGKMSNKTNFELAGLAPEWQHDTDCKAEPEIIPVCLFDYNRRALRCIDKYHNQFCDFCEGVYFSERVTKEERRKEN